MFKGHVLPEEGADAAEAAGNFMEGVIEGGADVFAPLAAGASILGLGIVAHDTIQYAHPIDTTIVTPKDVTQVGEVWNTETPAKRSSRDDSGVSHGYIRGRPMSPLQPNQLTYSYFSKKKNNVWQYRKRRYRRRLCKC